MIETNGDEAADGATAFWEDFYRDRELVWSGNANPLLVREVAGLAPGSALDLGCGEGADAIWLAARGWRVTAVDISATALGRAADRAAQAGVGDAITWARHDLTRTFPDGEFDLVSAQFLHSPVAAPGERDVILGRAADAVAVGGTLLVVSHLGWPSWVDSPPFDHRFPTVPEMVASLELESDRWRLEVAEPVEREVSDPDGHPGRRADSVIRAIRVR
jgi:SAM-dependent methyltransferase